MASKRTANSLQSPARRHCAGVAGSSLHDPVGGAESTVEGETEESIASIDADADQLSCEWLESQLADFIRKHGRLPEPGEIFVAGATVYASAVDLGAWSLAQARACDTIATTVYTNRWYAIYTLVAQHVRAHGKHPPAICYVPLGTDLAGNPEVCDIGDWCRRQYVYSWKLTSKQFHALERLNTDTRRVWHWNESLGADWLTQWKTVYTGLATYVHLCGRLPPRETNFACGTGNKKVDIGDWWRTQRLRQNIIPPELQRMLENLKHEGVSVWSWMQERHSSTLSKWKMIYAKVAEFVRANGRLPPQGCTLDCSSAGRIDVGVWCRNQKSRRETLPPELANALEQLADRNNVRLWCWPPTKE